MPKRDDTPTEKPKKSTTTTSVKEGDGSVSYTIEITKNTGNYENLKIRAGITIPYGASQDMLKKLDDLMVVAKEKVTKRVQDDLLKL